MVNSHCDRPVFDSGLPDDPIEIINYLFYQRENVRQRFRKVFSVGASLVEQYVKGAASIHLHLGDSDGRGACLEIGVGRTSANIGDMSEFTMLVSVGESVQDKQGVHVKSIVRLKALDHCDVFVREAFKAGRYMPSETLRTIIDRKLCALLLDSRIFPSQVEHQVIQGDASVQGKFAGEKTHLLPEFTQECFERFLVSLKVGLFGSDLKCSFSSEFNFKFQIRQLFLSPIYPELGVLKRAHAETLQKTLRESL